MKYKPQKENKSYFELNKVEENEETFNSWHIRGLWNYLWY